MKIIVRVLTIVLIGISLCGCIGKNDCYELGSYGYDLDFFKDHGINVIELKSPDGASRVMIAPLWQGRVMTSTTSGNSGSSYGWINHKYIDSGEVSKSFNPYGGEERFWIGPEGGPFSWYFKQGVEQIYENWIVPSVIDTEPFDVESQADTDVTFSKHISLTNASGYSFKIGVNRTISLLERSNISEILGVDIPEDVKLIAYSTKNTIANEGDSCWTKKTGLPSIWLLGMFNSTKTTTVFIPYNNDAEGKIVNDEYFGKVPSDRLIVDNGMIYFKIDGEYRSKIGLPKGRDKGLCGSYDSEKKVLNILKYTIPQGDVCYVNGQWGEQDDPFEGDVINSYNDGPTDNGTLMGPFYEIETSSPAAALNVGDSLTHLQYTMHFEGSETDLAKIIKTVFGVEVNDITKHF